MVNVQNISTIRELRKQAQLSNSEAVPTRLAESIVPVIDINPAHNRVVTLLRTTTRTATGAATILTTSSNRRTFITGINLAVTADATADNTSTAVTMTLKSDITARTVLQVNKQTVTAGSTFSSVVFAVPLELNPGSAIQHSSTFTAGTCSYTTTFYGYEVEEQEA